MKTLLQEETDGFLFVKKINNLFLSLILISSSFLAQININGFVKIEQFYTNKNSQNIISASIDDDDQADYVSVSSEKKLSIHLSGNGYQIQTVSLPYYITKIKVIGKLSNNVAQFAFVSRKDRVFGTLAINKKGKVSSLKTVKLDDNPDDFLLTNNLQKAVLYGRNFRGLEFVDFSLNEKDRLRLAEGALINTALFYDVDNDFHTDIIYYDLFNESLNLIKNENNFELINNRLSIDINSISNLKRFDFNSDGYDDILFVSKKGVEIFYGDSVTTFENRETLVKSIGVVDYIIADYNNDGENDIAYLQINDNKLTSLFISFSSNHKLTSPVLYSSKISVLDLINCGKNCLAYLNTINQVIIISPVNEIVKETLILGTDLVSLFAFPRGDSEAFNLAIIDSSDKKLKVYLDSLSYYFETSIKSLHKTLRVMDISNSEVAILAFTKDQKLLEVFKLDVNKGFVWTMQFYSHYNIDDVELQRGKQALPTIIVNSLVNNELFTEYLEYKDFRYQQSEPTKSKSNPEIIKKLRDQKTEYINSDSSKIIFAENNEVFLKSLNPLSASFETTNMNIKVKGPIAVQFVNRKNGFIFMINKETKMVEVNRF